jgi:hypothetical protein
MELDDNGVPKTLYALHPDRLVEWEGQFYIADAGLRTFYDAPHVGMIVKVAGKKGPIYLELDARFVHSQRDQHIVAWWVHRVEMEGWVPDTIPPGDG